MKKKIILAIVIIGIVSLIIPFTKAKFKSSTAVNKQLATATWDVSLNQTGINNNITLVAGGASQSYTLKVRSDSEVDVVYSIVIGNIPSGVQASINGTDYQTPVDGTVTFTNAGAILYSSQNKENTHTIYLKSSSGTASISNRQLTVDVVVKQIV